MSSGPAIDLARVTPAVARHVRDGHAAEREGRPDEARAHFERALRSLPGPEAAGLAASLLRWIARTHANAGDAYAALDCLEAAAAVATAMGDDRALASALNTRACSLFQLGELDEAEALYHSVRTFAARLGDRKLQAMTEQNLGSVASIRGDLERALGYFQASLAAYEALGESGYVGPLLNNIGRLQTDLGETLEARRTLARARRQCLAQGDRHHQIIVEVNWARLLLSAGRATSALRACERARRLTEAAGGGRWLPDIHLIRGTCHRHLGQADEALGSLQQAVEMARERGDAKLLADLALEQAATLRTLGRNRETLLQLNEAHRLFLHLRARRELADVDDRIHQLEEVFLQIVREWGASIEAKDPYTQGHSARVADYACRLAAASGLPEADMTWFRMGALLHDVGKVAIPLEILNKKGTLDLEERRWMSRHPVEGVLLLAGIEFPWDVRPMIRHHHERWDGTGYPDGLAGTAIPFAARILTVADIYDALTTTRSYRPGFSHERALEILRSEAGQTVDPALLALFLDRVAPHLPEATRVERSMERPRRSSRPMAPPARSRAGQAQLAGRR